MSEIHNEAILIKNTIADKSDLVIFDVGGCNFNDSIYLKMNFPHAQIYSFEPSQENLDAHQTRAELNGVAVVPVAIGDRDDSIIFYNSISHDGAGSVLKPKVKDGTEEGAFHEGLLFNMQGYEVQIVRLDTFCELNNIDRIDYLHIDVQGGEHHVIKGLGKYRPHFIFAETCEFGTYESGTSLEEFEDELAMMGYEIFAKFRDDTMYKLKNEFIDLEIPNWLPKI
jgi:FkbM family methyltransferase